MQCIILRVRRVVELLLPRLLQLIVRRAWVVLIDQIEDRKKNRLLAGAVLAISYFHYNRT